MKSLIILLTLFAVFALNLASTPSLTNFNTLDPHQVNELINKLSYDLANTNDVEQRKELLSNISSLLQVSNQHINHASWYYKARSIVTFTNLIALLIVFFLIIFVVSLFYDLIITFGLLSIEIIIMLMGGNLKFYSSYLLFGYLLYRNPNSLCYLGDATLIFYLICFYLMSSWHIRVIVRKNRRNAFKTANKIRNNSDQEIDIESTYIVGIIILTVVVTMLHNNYLTGTVATMLILYWNGCFLAKNRNDYAIGFNSEQSLKSTIILSSLMTTVFVLVKLDLVTLNSVMNKLMLFEYGVLFWCPLFSFVALLILCNHYTYDLKLVENVIILVVLILHLYFGFLIDSNDLINLSCVFLWLFCLTFEFSYVMKVGIRKFWILCGIILVNLFVIYYVGNNYPEYLMINSG